MSDCAAFTAMLDLLMSLLAREMSQVIAPRATRNALIIRLEAVRNHCDMIFGSAEEARLRCAFHGLLGEVAPCVGSLNVTTRRIVGSSRG